ncbi:MAG: CPBP family intramembrane glutamic endopeptidase [Polyangiaceae bacterium]
MAEPAKPQTGTSIVGWGLVVYGAALLAGSYLGQNATGAAAVQAVIAEFGAGRLAISWSDPAASEPTSRAIALRAARGAGLAIAVVILVIAFTALSGAASIVAGPGTIPQALIGLLLACLYAVRDELLLRGLVIRAFANRLNSPLVLIVCGLAAAAARYGASDCTLVLAISSGAAGVAFGALWLRDRGAWMAWGAHVAWVFATETLTHDGLVDVRTKLGAWGGGDAGLTGGYAGASVLLAVAVGALIWGSRAAGSPTRASLG